MQNLIARTSHKFNFRLVNQDVQIHVMPLRHVKRATLRYDVKAQEFKIRVPSHYKQAAVEGFLKEAQGWMEKQLSKTLQLIHIHGCKQISLMGNDVELSYHPSRRASFFLNDNKLHIMAPTPHFGPHLEKWLKQIILEYLIDKSEHYSCLLGVQTKKVSIRETKSRWGSCSSKGALSFNWRLIFAPKEIIEYVVAHEVAHLKEMNHSVKFWRLVEHLHPEMDIARKWLKINGSKLFQLQFQI